jgi:hypothetical protein
MYPGTGFFDLQFWKDQNKKKQNKKKQNRKDQVQEKAGQERIEQEQKDGMCRAGQGITCRKGMRSSIPNK